MSVRPILHIGDPRLREPARAVADDDLGGSELRQLVDDLVDTVRAANGAGIAATQIGVGLRVCLAEVRPGNPRYPYKPLIPLTVMVNPELEILTDERFACYEGCLSVPDLRGVAPRATHVRVRAVDPDGRPLEFDVRGLSAGTFQHEVDHLNGMVVLDRVEDTRTLATWDEYDRHHRAAFEEQARALVARDGA
jgi:peptide deformylase